MGERAKVGVDIIVGDDKRRAKRYETGTEVSLPTNMAAVDLNGQTPKAIECRAWVAYEPKKPCKLETVIVGAPQKGEVRIKIFTLPCAIQTPTRYQDKIRKVCFP